MAVSALRVGKIRVIMSELLESGKYVVAVSGGVDSVVLLDKLAKNKSLDLFVAHVDHGIREDSKQDAAFVKELARKYGLEFYSKRFELGSNASEDQARKCRYEFLNEVMQKTEAQAIVTAHHQDDLIETAAINLTRGTKRRGLVSLRSTEKLKRPLLNVSKSEIYQYAIKHKLEWQEDSTNSQLIYLRNNVRAKLHQTLSQEKRAKIIKILNKIQLQNQEIDSLVSEILESLMISKTSLKKSDLNKLDDDISAELLAEWFRINEITFDKKTIKRVQEGSQKLNNGSKIDLDKFYYCLITRNEIVITGR